MEDKQMKVSDYVARLLEKNGILDIFGIPGVGCGHFMNSISNTAITSHLVYNEQGAAFAACGYAQASGKVGFAYSTAGPGGTNLITGIANAFADSIPTIFMVGEKDLSELRGKLKVRQKASQEVDIVNICKPITKWSVQIKTKEEVRYVFEKAFYLAKSGRPGPVLIDFPSDIARAEIEPDELKSFNPPRTKLLDAETHCLVEALEKSKKPLFLCGNGIKQQRLTKYINDLSLKLSIPVVSTLVATDSFTGLDNYYGYIGMDGDSVANRLVNECDLLVTFGARMNFKQIGYVRENFAKQASIIRIDADKNELEYRLGKETVICCDLSELLPIFVEKCSTIKPFSKEWIGLCKQYKENSFRKPSLNPVGDEYMLNISNNFPNNTSIVVDVGSHRRWFMSQITFKEGQCFYQSAGLASMGYALPSAIGVYFATKQTVVCIDGDGGIMMNLQELQLVKREKIPLTIFVFNNHALGDIMEFQKKVFNKNYFTTTENSGYLAADFKMIAKAFDLAYVRVDKLEDVSNLSYGNNYPQLVEVIVPSNE